jgi:hypothetical protein
MVDGDALGDVPALYVVICVGSRTSMRETVFVNLFVTHTARAPTVTLSTPP